MKYSKSGDIIIVLFFLIENYLEMLILNTAYPTDDGSIGITGKNEARVFEPFYRLSAVIDDKYHQEEFGYGLGLTVVKKIIDLHKAKISIYTIKNHMNEEAENDVCATIRFTIHKYSLN